MKIIYVTEVLKQGITSNDIYLDAWVKIEIVIENHVR